MSVKSSSSPRLDTILMVESALKKSKHPMTVASLKKSLPKQVNHNTLMTILDYLEQSNKISFSVKGVGWSFDG